VSDFAESIRHRVERAREAAGEEEDVLRRQGGPRQAQLARRKHRTDELCTEIDQLFTEAAQSSSGAMVYDRRVDHYGRVTSVLSWQDPRPKRGLRIYANPLEGVMDRAWVMDRTVMPVRAVDLVTFGSLDLHKLIYALSDQAAWARGQPPDPL
jgi:hypothetical protein